MGERFDVGNYDVGTAWPLGAQVGDALLYLLKPAGHFIMPTHAGSCGGITPRLICYRSA